VHRFAVYHAGKPTIPSGTRGAHLIGNDGIPIRGDIDVVNDEFHCAARMRDPFGLSLLWPVSGFGSVQLETTRLPVRDKPYLLNLELARHRLMRITLKREEWGLFDYHGLDEISAQIDQARDLFIQALSAGDDFAAAAPLADEALRIALEASERISRFHADVFLNRRQQSGGFNRDFIGAAVSPHAPPTALSPEVCKLVDFIRVPFVWRETQPAEQKINFDHTDAWVKACSGAKLPLRGGPLLNFGVRSVPDWMYIWENDFDTIIEYARQHIQRCVKRYSRQVSTWIVASGLHADTVFSFNFEQIMELTRMAAATARDLAPRAQIVIDLTQPWGEYSARNQRTVPPLLFADMAVQSGIPFDAFGLQFLFGLSAEGYRLRDLLQISALIDKLANLGKTLHITAVAVPSAADAGGDETGGGIWHEPWSAQTQADWLSAFCEIALSKPYVDSVCLESLADNGNSPIPTGGVLNADFTPKAAFGRLAELVKRLQNPAAP